MNASSDRRPGNGVRYVLDRIAVEADHATYQGFAHLPAADVPLMARIDLPAGVVHVHATAVGGLAESRAVELSKTATALVRAATKAEIAAGLELPRRIVRWRA